MKNRDTETARHLQPDHLRSLELRQLEERLEVSTLAGGIVGQEVWDGGWTECCRSEKCDHRIVPWVLEDPAPDGEWS